MEAYSTTKLNDEPEVVLLPLEDPGFLQFYSIRTRHDQISIQQIRSCFAKLSLDQNQSKKKVISTDNNPRLSSYET